MPTLYQMLSGGMTREEHREKAMLEVAKERREAKARGKPVLDVHAGLDLLGMTPGVGAPADLLNAALYAAKGEESLSLLSLSQAVPLVGIGAAIKKLVKPSKQLKAATSYGDAYQSWWSNLQDFSVQNPGQVNFKKVSKDIANAPSASNSKDFYEWMKEYSQKHFGGYVTVPKASVAGKSKRKGKYARTPDKQKKETLQAKLREKELQEIRHDEFKRGTGYQAVTKRVEY